MGKPSQSQKSQSARSFKRALRDIEASSKNPQKYLKLDSTESSSVAHWLNRVVPLSPQPGLLYQSSSCPEVLTGPCGIESELRPDEITNMAPNSKAQSSKAGIQLSASGGTATTDPNAGTSTSTKSKTDDPDYMAVLINNGIEIDFSGRLIPKTLRSFLDSNILVNIEGTELNPNEIETVIDTAERIARTNEASVSLLLTTPMFPLDHKFISMDNQSFWRTEALPNDPYFEIDLSQPKPDHFFGYSRAVNLWSLQQMRVLDSPAAAPFTKPGQLNKLPFLVVETKSEIGGHLSQAEHQVAGSGAICVNGMYWLLKQAQIAKHSAQFSRQTTPVSTFVANEAVQISKDLHVRDNNPDSDSNMIAKTMAFSLAMNHRTVILYVHYRSEGIIRMSLVDTFITFHPTDVQRCSNIIKNILNWVLKTRHDSIAEALDVLSLSQSTWKRARKFSMLDELSSHGSNKRQRVSSETQSIGSDAKTDGGDPVTALC